MKTEEIANRLADYCKKGEFVAAQKELYGNDIISIEPAASPAFEKETKGKDKVLEKIMKFNDMVEETYSYEVSEPIVSGNAFVFKLGMDVKMKGQERKKMEEVCVYETKDGKVVSEQFFV